MTDLKTVSPRVAEAYLWWLKRSKTEGGADSLAAFQAGWTAHNHVHRNRRAKRAKEAAGITR